MFFFSVEDRRRLRANDCEYNRTFKYVVSKINVMFSINEGNSYFLFYHQTIPYILYIEACACMYINIVFP